MRRKNHKITLLLCCFGALVGLFIASYFLNKWIFSKSADSSLDLEAFSEPLITIRGVLSQKQFPGPPEYSSIEEGDRVDYCWVLELDKASFLLALNTPVKELGLDVKDILRRSNSGEVMLVLDEETERFCRDYEHQQVSVEGYLFHAHTSHHYTPMLLDVKKILD
jgi:hypothetical protein